ncbi:hypothetical protein [Cryobacterium lyxosi]|uniref:Uncharacterized protein n=1 Tax=Cryobacterium lyxosi TaxID=1259228 RepID=A0A4R8ZGX3_9MICO|nr:hypothetical protein [Cryobacterium lyxosi]TFD27730.1 hypothetical protein E3T27_04500 [Cryobacterium lyxosi]
MRAAVRASALVNLLVGTRSMTSCSASFTTNDSAGTRGIPRCARARCCIDLDSSGRGELAHAGVVLEYVVGQ